MTNANAPVFEYGWGSLYGAGGAAVPLNRYVDVTGRSRGSIGTQRGKQYELDAVQSGTLSATLANQDAALDPTNLSGPFAGHIAPYQPFRARAQYPPTPNLLTPVQATGGDAGGYDVGVIPTVAPGVEIGSDTDATGGSIVADGTAWQGARALQFAVPAGTVSGKRVCLTAQVAALPGQTYTMQMRVRNVTPSTTVSIAPHHGVYGPVLGAPATYTFGGTTVLTGSATAAWTLVTVTATAPTVGIFGMNVGITVMATSGAACSVQVDGWQLEKGAVATTWVAPGTWYPIYAGFTERWPSAWNLENTYGVVQPTMVDPLALLSLRTLGDALTEEIKNKNPRFLYKLDDPEGVESFADATGTYPAATLEHGKFGAGSLVSGSAITATDPVNGVFTGSSGTVVTVNNPTPGTGTISPASYISLTKAGIVGPVGSKWTRMLAFRYTGPMPTSTAYIWDGSEKKRPSNNNLTVSIDSAGRLAWGISSDAGGFTNYFSPPGVSVVDGNWHLIMFGHDTVGGSAFSYIDGVAPSYGAVSSAYAPVGLVSDSLGNWVDVTNGGGTAWNFKGDIAFAAEFPSFFTQTDMDNIYDAWRNSCKGDTADARYQRIVRYAGYTGGTSIPTPCLTRSMGPMSTAGQDATSALQDVVTTEGGNHFVDAAGKLTFLSRARRYNTTAPVYTFGERTDLGEFPYEDIALDFDPTHLANIVAVTQAGPNQVFTATDLTSKNAYFERTLSRTLNTSSALECQDAAYYLLSRYRQPATRVQSLKIHPAAYPALWPVALSLELGMRVRVMKRPLGLPAISVDAFVEKIQWDLDDKGEAFVTLQCSPVDLTQYGVIASWHATFNAPTIVGATSITINASADNTNPLRAQLYPGQVLCVSPTGTTSKEFVTVQAVGGTSPGWSVGVITLTAGLAKSHSSGATICEVLPGTITDATTWDTSSKFDAVAFAY